MPQKLSLGVGHYQIHRNLSDFKSTLWFCPSNVNLYTVVSMYKQAMTERRMRTVRERVAVLDAKMRIELLRFFVSLEMIVDSIVNLYN